MNIRATRLLSLLSLLYYSCIASSQAQDCPKAWMYYEQRVLLSKAASKNLGFEIPIEKIQIDFMGAPVGVPYAYAQEEYSPSQDRLLIPESDHLWMHKAAYQSWLQLKYAAALDHVSLELNNVFRNYSEQVAVYKKYGARRAERAGYSEHHLYTAADLKGVNNRAFLWLLEHAFEYGWAPTYFFRMQPKIMRERWHWRYIGPLAAQKFYCAWKTEIEQQIQELRAH